MSIMSVAGCFPEPVTEKKAKGCTQSAVFGVLGSVALIVVFRFEFGTVRAAGCRKNALSEQGL